MVVLGTGGKPRHTHRKSTANPISTFIDDVSKEAINMTGYIYLGTLSLSPGVVYCPGTGSLTVYFSHIYSVQVAMYVEKNVNPGQLFYTAHYLIHT